MIGNYTFYNVSFLTILHRITIIYRVSIEVFAILNSNELQRNIRIYTQYRMESQFNRCKLVLIENNLCYENIPLFFFLTEFSVLKLLKLK